MPGCRQTHILVACDAFKGTLPSYRVGEAAERGIRHASQVCLGQENGGTTTIAPTSSSWPSLLSTKTRGPLVFHHCPMSDGGAGLLDSLTYGKQGVRVGASSGDVGLERVCVPPGVAITGPLGTPIDSHTTTTTPVSFACSVPGRVLVLEMAEASGLPRVPTPAQRNPLLTTSYGTGETLRYALRYMERELNREGGGSSGQATPSLPVDVFIGIGGSATNDGGLGALQGLGVLELFVREGADTAEKKLTRPFRGGDLARLSRVAITSDMEKLFSPPTSPEEAVVGESGACRVYIRQVRLICDVDNPLVGRRGATYTFGPQKCAPRPALPPGKAKPIGGSEGNTPSDKTAAAHVLPKEKQDAVVDDGAVGVVTSAQQQAVLDALEAGMHHAAMCVVSSTFTSLRAFHSGRLPGAATGSRAGSGIAEDKEEERTALETLLHGAGGGGAGGMSGFFRYILGATWMAGTDAVAQLLSLRIPPSREGAERGDTPTGLLYTHCDVLVSGEGSFDVQTISSHKTVGRLLEMAVEANLASLVTAGTAARTRERESVGGKRIKEFVVVCGRMGFANDAECQARVREALAQTFLPRRFSSGGESGEGASLPADGRTARTSVAPLLERYVAAEKQGGEEGRRDESQAYRRALEAATPRVTVLPLSPSPFSAKEAMSNPYACVQKRLADYCRTGGAAVMPSSI